MWLYFNQNGRLLEVSEYDGQARAGTTAFKIYAVFENIDIDTVYTQATLKLYKPDIDGGSYPIILMEKEQNATFEGPTGVHFLHGQSYKCYSFDFSDLQSGGDPVVLLDIPGLWYAVITLRDARRINVVGSSSFNVQDGIPSETGDIEAFDAVLDYFYRHYGGGGGVPFVPYVGAEYAVDLGNHYLKTSSYINIQGTLYNTFIDSRGINITADDYDFTLDFPTSENQSETIATQEWVQSQDYLTEHQSLAGYVPYTGATNDVDLGNYALKAGGINLQKDNSQGASIKVNAGENSQGSAYGQLYVTNDYYPEGLLKLADAMGTATTYSPTSIKVLGSQYKISFPTVQQNEVFALESKTKLYRHTVTVAPNGYTDFIVLTIISRSGNSISDMSDLEDNISGFIVGAYIDEHSLNFVLLECSIYNGAITFGYIDENNTFADPTWNNASVSNDTVEEI